ncbi:hypothetical protein Pelo_18870 [Pelomyxa schiedti]|nr:hypothetical protein Pelo_18870 [Pelomyxa schiedti]
MEGAMRGFDMKRPEITEDTMGCFWMEPECMRPSTSGLPPLTIDASCSFHFSNQETEIQCVENRIKWFRQRKCVGWARGLMASGQRFILLSNACKHAWSEWFQKETRVLMKVSPAWKLILRSCKTTASRSIAFLCGAHPRVGKDSPLSLLGPDILASILMLFRGFSNCSYLDGLQREPRQTEVEASMMDCSPWDHVPKWHTSPDKTPVLAFGNFNLAEHQCGMAFYTVLSAYALLYELGPWVPLDDFVTAVEIGNVANLQCFAFFRSGAYLHTPQERFMAIRLHQTLFGSLTEREESNFNKCFTGDGFVAMASGHKTRVSDINVGDWVKTESGIKKVVKVEKKPVNRTLSMCNVSGVWLTPGHPVFMDGTWKHPFEITRVRTVFVDELFNFELSGGPMSPDHSVFINGLLPAGVLSSSQQLV